MAKPTIRFKTKPAGGLFGNTSANATAQVEYLNKRALELSQLEVSLNARQKELDAREAKLTQFEAELKKRELSGSAEIQAQRLLASLGVPHDKTPKAGNFDAPGDVLEQYEAIEDPISKTEFYRRHRDAFQRAAALASRNSTR